MDQFGYYNQNYPVNANNRVYINPNFNRNVTQSAPLIPNSNIMYFNPIFSNQISSQQKLVPVSRPVAEASVRPRIHVNPNFIKQNQNVPSSVPSSMANTLTNITRPATCNQLSCTQKAESVIQPTTQTPVSKSRYSLVRKKENNDVKISNTKVTNTVKVNKYKIVSLNTVKSNITTDKLVINKVTEVTVNQNMLKSKYKIRTKPIVNINKVNNVQNSRFKYVKRNSASILNLSTRTNVRRASLTMNKSLLKTNIQPLKKIVKGALKKNNVPCPQYKKYGKCLRMVRAQCDFLHDKKHVSICRKFMKGICHDERCLLSHDLTDKKMPTCYFYLQGMCTKETCPYLHVKLNEKAKICQDFIRGYCERGDKCIHRHVDITKTNMKTNSTRQNSTKTYKRMSTKFKRKSSTGHGNKDANESKAQATKPNDEDGRYFKEAAIEKPDEQCNLIKPSRCKLGTLPSFIQL